jgi:hypothetical protein
VLVGHLIAFSGYKGTKSREKNQIFLAFSSLIRTFAPFFEKTYEVQQPIQ